MTTDLTTSPDPRFIMMTQLAIRQCQLDQDIISILKVLQAFNNDYCHPLVTEDELHSLAMTILYTIPPLTYNEGEDTPEPLTIEFLPTCGYCGKYHPAPDHPELADLKRSTRRLEAMNDQNDAFIRNSLQDKTTKHRILQSIIDLYYKPQPTPHLRDLQPATFCLYLYGEYRLARHFRRIPASRWKHAFTCEPSPHTYLLFGHG